MSSHGIRFLLGLLGLLLVFGLAAALLLSGRDGAVLRGALAGVVGGALSAALSYALMVQVLGATHLGFLRAHFAGMLLRILTLGILGLVVWGSLKWSSAHYLIAVALTYPFFLFLEAWQLNRRLSERSSAEKAQRT